MTEQSNSAADGKNPATTGNAKTGSKADKPKKPVRKDKRPARWPAALAVLLALVAAGGSAYTWYTQQQQLAAQKKQLTELQTTLRALDEHPSLIEIKQRLSEQTEQLNATLAEHQETIDALY